LDCDEGVVGSARFDVPNCHNGKESIEAVNDIETGMMWFSSEARFWCSRFCRSRYWHSRFINTHMRSYAWRMCRASLLRFRLRHGYGLWSVKWNV